MHVVEPGHVYALQNLDAPVDAESQLLVFVNRDGTGGDTHGGTQTQEVLRACVDLMDVLIDRTNHCDACLRWEGNDRIIKALSEARRQMNLAILFHEQRVNERRMEKEDFDPSKVSISSRDGHWNTPE
jgi:hypothetical protein